MKKFAFTIRKTSRPGSVTQRTYYNFLGTGIYEQKSYHPEVLLKFEKKGGLHVHGLLTYDEELGVDGTYMEPRNKHHVYRMFKPRKGFHITVKEVFNYDGWLEYISKEEEQFEHVYTVRDAELEQEREILKFLRIYKKNKNL